MEAYDDVMVEQLLNGNQLDAETAEGLLGYHDQGIRPRADDEWAFDLDDPASPMTATWVFGSNPLPEMCTPDFTSYAFDTENPIMAQHLSFHNDLPSGNHEFTTPLHHALYAMSTEPNAIPSSHSDQPHPYHPPCAHHFASPASDPDGQVQAAFLDIPTSLSASEVSAETSGPPDDRRDTSEAQYVSNTTTKPHVSSRLQRRRSSFSVSPDSAMYSSDAADASPSTEAPRLLERQYPNKHNEVERKYRNRLNAHFKRLLSVLPPGSFHDSHSGSGGHARPKAITRSEVLEIATRIIGESQRVVKKSGARRVF